MKIAFLTLAAFTIPGMALAQLAKLPTNPPSAEQVLTAASPAAAAVFVVGPRGEIVHQPSGYGCPMTGGSAALTGVALQGEVAYCQYADNFQPVIRLEFLPQAYGYVLPKAFCEGLPAALGVDVGPPLTGARRLEGPNIPSRMGEVLVKGEWRPIWQCTWIRAPFRTTDILIDIAAIRPAGGWTVRLIQTQARPGRNRNPLYSVYDLLRPIFMIGTVVAGENAPHR